MHTRPRQRKERPPPMQHRDSRCKSKAILNQALSTWCLCEQHSPRARTIPQVTRSTDVPAIHLLSQKAWTRKPLFFEKKTKTKISQSTPEKTASRTWNVTRMGFQLKHGKQLLNPIRATSLFNKLLCVLQVKFWLFSLLSSMNHYPISIYASESFPVTHFHPPHLMIKSTSLRPPRSCPFLPLNDCVLGSTHPSSHHTSLNPVVLWDLG